MSQGVLEETGCRLGEFDPLASENACGVARGWSLRRRPGTSAVDDPVLYPVGITSL